MRVDNYGVVGPKPKRRSLVNLNELAKEVSKLEGGKFELNIAEIKEVIRCVSIAVYKDPDLFHLLIRNGKKWVRNYKSTAKK